MMNNYKIEKVWEIWENSDYHIEVGVDRDELGLVEIREFEGDELLNRMTLDNEALDKLIECLIEFREWRTNDDKKVPKETNSD